MDRFVRYYLMPEVWSTVTDSQVFGWVKMANEGGYMTHCVSIVDFRKYLKTRRTMTRSVQDLFGGRFIQIPIIERASLFIDIQVFFVLLFLWAKEVLGIDKLVFQSRISGISFALSWIRHFPKVRVIFDSRGAELEELKYGVNGEKRGWRMNARVRSVSLHEQKAVSAADHVFVVSDQLKKYHLSMNRDLSGDHITVVPGAADHHVFSFDESLRQKGRVELALNDEIVLVYAGGLKARWAAPEKMFELLGAIRRFEKRALLLLLTPDLDIAESLRIQHGFSMHDVVARHPRHTDVARFMNAADIGLLLREVHPTNANASPTKFAEYILCGLPVIISASINDYADFARTHDVGFVLESLDHLVESGEGTTQTLCEFVRTKGRLSGVARAAIMDMGMTHLSKQAHLPGILKILETV